MRERLSIGLVLFVTGVIAPGCATTRAPQRVTRAPAIALAPGQQYSVEIEAACRGVWQGPTMVANRQKSTSDGLFGKMTTTVTRMQREGETGACVGGGNFAAVARSVQARLAAAMKASNHSQAPAGAGVAPLRIELIAEEVRDLEPPSTRKDSGKDRTCQDICGVPECLQYSWSANVEASARVYGPPVYGRPQEAYDFASWNALRGAAQKIGCKGNNPDAWFRDESRYDWSNAWEQVNDALGRRFEETMKPRTEVASIALFDGGIDTPVNEKGVALARQSKWADALAAFDAAIVEQQATKPGNAQAKARLLHNRAAALMALGRLEEAAKTQLEAHAIEKDGDTAELGAEIAQRAMDEAKMRIHEGRDGASGAALAPKSP